MNLIIKIYYNIKMQGNEKEQNADGLLNKFGNIPNVESYIVFNAEGIVVRFHGKKMNYQKAV